VAELTNKIHNRIIAIDWMRGIVMILMALDHASGFFNEGRLFTDSILLYDRGNVLAVDQFMTRWITHICAPTFIFLTGASMAISNVKRLSQGMLQTTVNREFLIRGVIIMLLDLCVLSLASGKPVLQVLYAIGVSMIIMVWLRHLRIWTVLILSTVILTGAELLLSATWHPENETPLWLALTFAPVLTDTYSVLYPVIPWLSIMMLGWVFGKWSISVSLYPHLTKRVLLICGCVALLLFVIIRGLDGYGNMFMLLNDNSIIHWLHVSKYPPSLSYILLELGLMAIILSALIWLEPIVGVRYNGFITVFGQTALFFYLIHFAVLAVLSLIFEQGGLEMAYLMAILTLMILYPICRVYRMLKWRNPQSILRFI